MDNARGFVLHTADWTGEGSLRVNNALALTASLDVLKAIAEGGGVDAGGGDENNNESLVVFALP